MQITEIRWATGYPGKEAQRYRLPLRQGLTFIHHGQGDKADSPIARLQRDLIYPPDGTFEDAGTPSLDYWQFLFHDADLFYSYSTDQAAPDRDQFFRSAIVGCESEILGSRINYTALSARGESADTKKEQLEQLLTRLDESRNHLYDRSADQGKIPGLQAEIRQCAGEISRLKDQAESWPGDQQVLEKTKKRLAGLKAEDQKLAGEQRRIKYLMVKAEYESLEELLRELHETLEREGVFGSRITEKGHNITVHEMTSLTALRKEVADLEQEAGSVAELLERTKAERIKAEQERIMAMRRREELDREKSRLQEQIGQAEETGSKEDPAPQGHAFPTGRQIGWLMALLILATGLLLLLFKPTAGAILTGVGLLALLALGLLTLKGRFFARLPSLTGRRDQEQLSLMRSELQQLSARIAGSTLDLDRLDNYIGELDGREAEFLAEAGAIGRKYRRAENEMMRLIRQYAGASESSEADEIITALSRQRESSASYNEMVANLQRRIADLTYGRSQEELLREYQQACRELGQVIEEEEMAELPDRARAISQARIELAAAIDEAEADLREKREQLGSSRESSVSLGGIERRYQALTESYRSAVHDYLCINGAVAWLKEILNQWREIDINAWMARSAAYLNRLTGRRPGGQAVSLPGVTPRDRLRAPRLSSGIAGSRPDLAGVSIFLNAPQSARYLAVRLGLIASRVKDGFAGSPLLFLEPVIPPGYSQAEYLLSTLEEWSLETGQQLVYVSRDPQLTAIAQAREMTLYYLS